MTYVFYTHNPGDLGYDDMRTRLYNESMDYQTVLDLKEPLQELKLKMEALGYKIGEPEVFIAFNVG